MGVLRTDKGVGFVEVLSATVLFLIALAAITSLFISAQKQLFQPEYHLAAQLGVHKVERLKDYVRNTDWNTPGSVLYPNEDKAAENISVEGRTYTVDYAVQNVTGRDYRRVTVDVQYTPRHT